VNVGRPEKTIDPAAGPVARFAYELRQLRGAAGLSYRDMAARTHYSAGTLAQAADGRRLPSLALTLAYVQVCGGDVEDWRARWQELSREPRSAPAATESPVEPPTEPSPRRFGWLRWRHVRLAVVVLLAVLAGVTAGGMMLVSANDEPGNRTFGSVTGPSCVEDLVRGTYANN
jgi:transcriptional regulator with XRE-family HTH domain